MRKTHFFFVLYYLFLTTTIAIAQTIEQSTVCIYYKRINPDFPGAGYYMMVVNNTGSSGKFVIHYNSKADEIFVEGSRSKRNIDNTEQIKRELERKIGAFFSDYDIRKLSTPNDYKVFFDRVLDGTQKRSETNKVIKPLDLRGFGITDRVFSFNFDSVEKNYNILQSPDSPEALALYNFTMDQWKVDRAPIDYKQRISRTDFKQYLNYSIVDKIVELKKEQVVPIIPEATQRLIRSADSRATWGMIISILGLIATILVGFLALSRSKAKEEQLVKIELKLKHLDAKINRPFYQSENVKANIEGQALKIAESTLLRLAKLERQIGLSIQNKQNKHVDLQSGFAKDVLILNNTYINKWASSEVIIDKEVLDSLILFTEEFNNQLQDLDLGMDKNNFVQNFVIPHIDRIDNLYQIESDAQINTPEYITSYFKELMALFSLKEIEVKQKISRFDVERHETAGAIFKTPYESGTIIKVLRRGIIYDNRVRKAQVIKAE